MRLVIVALLLVAAPPSGPVDGSLPHPTPPPPSPAAAPVSVRLHPTTVSTRVGQRFSFSSTVQNHSDQPASGLVAHLNVLGLDPEVYVDPEDWSSQRTIYLDPLPARATRRLAWAVQAVNSGRLVIYVTVTARQGTDAVTASNALRLAVAPQRTVAAGGILPLVVAMPTAVLFLTGVAAYRRRSLR